jgi:hypothetical protein
MQVLLLVQHFITFGFSEFNVSSFKQFVRASKHNMLAMVKVSISGYRIIIEIVSEKSMGLDCKSMAHSFLFCPVDQNTLI